MTNKSVTYMLVAIVVGVMLVSAVPDQIAMYVTPQQTLSIEVGDPESVALPKSGEGGVELYLDSTSSPEENVTEDHEILFQIENGTGYSGPWNGTLEVDELGSRKGDEINDLNEQVSDLADELINITNDFEDVKSDISEVTAVAEDAVVAANAATEAVAATAGSASQAAADAAEAANASREASSGLSTITMFIWYAVDALIAFGVYLLAKRRFS